MNKLTTEQKKEIADKLRGFLSTQDYKKYDHQMLADLILRLILKGDS